MHRVLITGAAGGIGQRLRADMQGLYPVLRLSDREAPAPAGPGEEVVAADLADFAACEAACADVDGIVHLGGQAVEGDWETVLQANIVGGYNLFEAARRQGVKRVVFASTNHVIGFYPRTQRIDHHAPPRPDSRYGVSKAFGEALGALYAEKHGMGVLAIRIGNFGDRPLDRRRLSIWISPRDFLQLVRIGLEHPELRYEVVYGASGPGAKVATPSEPNFNTQKFAPNQGQVWMRFIGKNATLPSLTGNPMESASLGITSVYFINNGKLVNPLSGSPIEITVYKVGGKYLAARGNEFGYVNYEFIPAVAELNPLSLGGAGKPAGK